MELRQIKELMAAMSRHGTRRLVYEENGVRLELESEAPEPSAPPQTVPVSMPAFHHQVPAAPPSPVGMESSKKEEKKPEVTDNSVFVISPIVGTFYRSPGPEEKAFVEVGDRVDENTIVCIVEAMKVMNEVKAGVSGRVVEVLIDDAHPVEFGSKLIRVEP